MTLSNVTEMWITTDDGERYDFKGIGDMEMETSFATLEDNYANLKLPTNGEATLTIPRPLFYRRMFLRLIGIGNGTNNWFKLRGGIMERNIQIKKAGRMLR